jgi:hypothetical protein
MSTEDYFDPYGVEDDEEYASEVECRNCGAAGLHWEEELGSYRLYDARGGLHKCSEKRLHKAVASDFEDLT